MKMVSEWTLNETAHLEFGKFCAIERNQKYKIISERSALHSARLQLTRLT